MADLQLANEGGKRRRSPTVDERNTDRGPLPAAAARGAVPPGYLDEAAVAAQLDTRVQTLRKWAVQRKGPPRTKVGKRVLYREEALRTWLVAQERDPAAARRAGMS